MSSRQFVERGDLLLSVWGEGSGTVVEDHKGSLFPVVPFPPRVDSKSAKE